MFFLFWKVCGRQYYVPNVSDEARAYVTAKRRRVYDSRNVDWTMSCVHNHNTLETIGLTAYE